MSQDIRQVAFMPWAGIETELCLGNYKIWPFAKFKETYISNRLVREQLEKIFGRYFERKIGKNSSLDAPVNSIVIVSPKQDEVGARQFSEDEKKDLLSISHSLAFTSIIDNFSAKASETFSLYIQNFKLGGNGITVFDTIYSDLEMVKFMKPYSADRSLIPFTGSNLLEALGQALSQRANPEVERIFRSLEFFFWANTRNEHTFYYLRTLSSATAFEILLDGYKGKLEFMDKIGNRLNRLLAPEEIMWDTRPLQRGEAQNDEKRSVIEWWAYDFYNLRNSIIHGKKVGGKDFIYKSGRNHFEIGIILFKRCVKQILVQKGFLVPKPVVDELMDIIMPGEWFENKEIHAQI